MKKDLGLSNWETKKSEVFRFLKETNLTFDLVFADPPYLDDQIDEFVDFIIEGNILSKNGIFVLEHVANRSFNRNELFKSKKYGDSMLSFYKKI